MVLVKMCVLQMTKFFFQKSDAGDYFGRVYRQSAPGAISKKYLIFLMN